MHSGGIFATCAPSALLNVAYIDHWLLSNGMNHIPLTQTVKGNNEHWYLDQRVLSARLALTDVTISKIKRNTDDRIDRSFPATWPSKLGVEGLKRKVDIHTWLPAFTDPEWAELCLFMTHTLSEKDIATLVDFKERYVKAKDKPGCG